MISLYGLFILLLTAEAIHAQVLTWFMFDPLFWVLPHFATHYTGQTTQGNTNEGDGANQDSGSKDAARLPLRVYPLRLKNLLQESNTRVSNGVDASASPKPQKKCKGGNWFINLFKPCPQQQSPPESQTSISYDPLQFDEMSLPVREAEYFESEYLFERKLSEGNFGVVSLATKNSDGMKVACKSIPDTKVDKYALESIPYSICHLRNLLVRSEEPSAIQSIVHSKKPSVEQCMSSRPPDLSVPYAFLLQMHLSRPGHENPYVPVVFDYVVLKNEFIVIMEYFGEDWLDLFSYLKEKIQLDVIEARDIFMEVVNAMISLKQRGVMHWGLHAKNVMYNPKTGEVKLIGFGTFSILPGWEEGNPFSSKSSNPPSTVSESKAGDDELYSMWLLGQLLDRLLTGIHPYSNNVDHEAILRETLFPDSDTYKSGLKEKAIELILALVSSDTDIVSSFEAILMHSFFSIS
ncbi:hypothetical protein BASA83_005756 [Batrachochytrium salamandrivorans]|nr:hypothetical protein BASA83_005756 [Batrachochytrium salamandrivorans]